MKVLELFAGSCSFSNVAKEFGYETFTTDYNDFDGIDYVVDILDFDINGIPFWPDIIWASPPCTTFSIASCGYHWNAPDENGNREPKTEEAETGLLILEQTIWILNELQPKYFVIENPRGLMRKMDAVQYLKRDTVTYCQYGDNRMKPTDLWHNLNWTPRPMCKNGMPCHVAAPRGSKTGTQGLKGNYERSKIPYELCKEILEYINNDI